jgi:penicillin-binding protein 2
MAAEFGLGQPTGFDIGSETRGLVPTPAWKRLQQGVKWWEGDTAQLSIGQSYLLVTPLQMACVGGHVRESGHALHPYVVKRIETADGQVVHEGQPDVRAHLDATPQQIEVVRHAMLGAVQDAGGTAHTAAVKGLSVAGKTGTAQYKVAGRELPADRAWFIGFAPYDQPAGGDLRVDRSRCDGSHTAAAVASAVFAQIFGKKEKDRVRSSTEVYED